MAQSGRAGAASGPARHRAAGSSAVGSSGRSATDRSSEGRSSGGRSPAGRRSGSARQGAAGSGLGRQRERLRAVVERVVTGAGYDLEDLAVSRAGNRSVVRVVVDGEDGVSSDAIADLSRDVSTALDAEEQSAGPLSRDGYTLEVSSPGVDRPLTLPRHWRRNRGRLVKVRLGEATRTGRVLAADQDGVRLDFAGETREVSYSDLGPGRVQIEFGGPTPVEASEDGGSGGQNERDEPGKEEA